MSVVKRLPTESKPNGMANATPFRKVYVVNTLGKAVSIIDVDKDEIVKVLRFNSETGTPGYDAVAKKIYVTLRSTNEVAEIDPSTDRVIDRYSVEGCVSDHGMAVDSEHHRAFLLCGGSHNLTVFALDRHKAIAHFSIPAGADVIKCDDKNGGRTRPVRAAPSLSCRKTTPNTSGRSRTFQSRGWCTALR